MGYIFIHTMAFGRVDKFLDKYHAGFGYEYRENIKEYLRLCKEQTESLDNGLLTVGKHLGSFK